MIDSYSPSFDPFNDLERTSHEHQRGTGSGRQLNPHNQLRGTGSTPPQYRNPQKYRKSFQVPSLSSMSRNSKLVQLINSLGPLEKPETMPNISGSCDDKSAIAAECHNDSPDSRPQEMTQVAQLSSLFDWCGNSVERSLCSGCFRKTPFRTGRREDAGRPGRMTSRRFCRLQTMFAMAKDAP